MAKALVKTRKVGGSIMVRIPKELVEQEDIREGDLLELEVQKAEKDWFARLPDLKPFLREEELDSHE